MNDEARNHLLKSCDMYCEKAKKNGIDDSIIKKSEELKQRIIDIGFATAPALLCIGRKV
jgi:hypothetical protein